MGDDPQTHVVNSRSTTDLVEYLEEKAWTKVVNRKKSRKRFK
jgi:hypothetical protein